MFPWDKETTTALRECVNNIQRKCLQAAQWSSLADYESPQPVKWTLTIHSLLVSEVYGSGYMALISLLARILSTLCACRQHATHYI